MSRVDDDSPTIWLLIGHKIGDNGQVRALAEALGHPVIEKQLRYRGWELATNLLLRRTLAGLRRSECDPLEPPWPDLLITAGRRNEPVARWIGERSGRTTKLVHLGRPWAHPRHFDLVVATPQYSVPPGPTVLENELPLHRLTDAKLATAAERWAPVFDSLPRPWFSLLVGGSVGRHTFDDDKLGRLIRGAETKAREAGGALLVTTSARTPGGAAAALDALEVPTHRFAWGDAPEDNPYLGYLALADEHIVTGDSMSMLTEACVTRRPVHVFSVGQHPVALAGEAPPRLRPWWRRRDGWRVRSLKTRLAMSLAPRRMMRNVEGLQRSLIASGRAVWFGDPAPTSLPPEPPDDLARAVDRVRDLLGRDRVRS